MDGLREKVARFPEAPGVYIFTGGDGATLYVGKAANLRARVRNYLRPGGDGRPLLRFLEGEAVDVEFVVTGTEQEALLLENTVIKKRKPRYNIKLKDDKAFLMLRLDRSEAWPWYRLVRRRGRDGARYFGPYASAKAVRRTLRLLHKVVPLRDCTDSVFHNRARACLKHQIGRCPAPCVGLVSAEEYDQLLDASERILRGDVEAVLDELSVKMERAARDLEFERAQALKIQIQALQRVSEKQGVVTGDGDQDVFGIHRAGDDTTVAVLQFRDGHLENQRRFRFRSTLPDELVLGDVLTRFYEGDAFVPREVLVPVLPVEDAMVAQWLGHKRGGAVELHHPQRGRRRRHLDLAAENARLIDAVHADENARRLAAGERLARLLDLDEPVRRIHCLDVSTIQGTNTVASRISFVDGRPHKDGYRKFKISADAAGDDFSSMAEAVRRSLALCVEKEDGALPDLMLIDGGKGQLGAALEAAREVGVGDEVTFAGLAKSRLRGVGKQRERSLERLVLAQATDPFPLAPDAPETLVVAAARDEAHRFAITYHRQLRGRLTSALDEVPGIGPGRRRSILRHFGSLRAVRAATREDLRGVPGLPASVADAVFDRLRDGADDRG